MFWFLVLFPIIAIANANRRLPSLTSTDAISCVGRPKVCFDSPYRSYDGSCNNLKYSWWGMTNTPYKRLLGNNYSDGIHKIAKSKNNKELPNCREVSLQVYSVREIDDLVWTVGFMQHGQIIAHDLALTSGVRQTNALSCCINGQYTNTTRTDPRCDNIIIPKNDRINAGRVCMNFYRTETTRDRNNCVYTTKVAEQLSEVTSYLDASFVYGIDNNQAKSLRAGRCGKLKSIFRNGNERLPQNPNATQVCPVKKATDPCYLAGDTRVNQSPELALLQNIYLILHNNLAGILCKLNPQWNDEITFQEARRIVIAILQNIVYYEIIPALIGIKTAIDNRIIYLNANNYINDYNPNVNAATSNEFSTGCFRFFHTAIQGPLKAYNESRAVGGKTRLVDNFNNPGILEYKNNFEGFSRGLGTQPQTAEDNVFVSDVRDFLFKDGVDLKAVDCQRGRDHGLDPYYKAVEACGLGRINSFKDFEKFMNKEAVQKLQALYESYEDVDLEVGVTLEKVLPGALCGPVASCFITDQLYRSRVGDYYFFENNQNKCSFTRAQLNAIRKVTFARLLCQVPQIKYMQPKAFELITSQNALVDCDRIPPLDINLWKTNSRTGCAKQ